MDSDFLKTKLGKLVMQRNILLVPILVLGVAVCFLSKALVTREERIVIIPTRGASFSVGKHHCDKEYLRSFGVYLSSLLFSKDQKSAPFKNRELLTHIHPSRKKAFASFLAEEQQKLEEEKASFVLEMEKASVNEKAYTFTIEGTQKRWFEKGGEDGFRREQARYLLSFHMEGGKLYLLNIKKEKL